MEYVGSKSYGPTDMSIARCACSLYGFHDLLNGCTKGLAFGLSASPSIVVHHRSSLKWHWHHVLLCNTTHGFLMISGSMLIIPFLLPMYPTRAVQPPPTRTYQDLPGPTRTYHPPGSPTSGRTQRATWPWSDLKRGVSSNPCAQRDPTSPGEWYPERQLSELSGVKRPEQFGHLSAWVAGTDILRQLI